MIRRAFFLACGIVCLAKIAVGCGEVEPSANPSTLDGGTDGASPSSTVDAGSNTTAPPDSGASDSSSSDRDATSQVDAGEIPKTCEGVRTALVESQVTMRQCCPTCNSIQCQYVGDDPCCPF